jgi:peptidoglycan/xylan/chitin deacetylase (PgdA/CDA1 family)
VITFDDGFRNFANVAYPVLRAKSLPVTVFLSSGLIGSSELFWFDRVERVLLQNRLQEISLRVGHRRLQIVLREKEQAIKQLVEEMKALSYSERERVLAELVRMSGDSKMESLGDEYLPMSWEEVRELAKDKNVTFGSHTVSHSIVRWLGEEDLHREIVQSKKTLEDNLQGPIEHFSYPNGQAKDFNHRAKKLLALAGYKSASTTIEDLNYQDTDCFELRRIGASLSLGQLIPKISGFDGFLVRSFGNLPGVKERCVRHTRDVRLG